VKRLDSGLRNLKVICGRNDNILLRATDRLERFFDSRGLKRAIWAVLILSAIYFGPVIFNIFNR
jgi:hypothetical protein